MDHPFRDPNQVMNHKLELRLSRTPALTQGGPQLEEAVLLAFINDVAMGLVEMNVIAARYGITLEETYQLTELPAVAKRIKARRALWESEDNVTERNRICYGMIALDAAAVLDRQLHDPKTHPAVVIDGLKVAGKFGGLEVQPRQTGPENGQTTSPVNIQIVFSGGTVEKIALKPDAQPPPTIEGEAA